MLSLQSLPVHLTCVIISALRKTPSSPTALADGCSREGGHVGAGLTWAGTSCSPRDGCTVFLGLHTQCSYAGGLAVWINIEIIAINSPTHPGTSKQAAHMCLSHVAASWTGHTQEVRDTSRTMRVRGHAGGDRVTRHDAAGHWRCSTAAPDPRRVLDLEEKTIPNLKQTSYPSFLISHHHHFYCFSKHIKIFYHFLIRGRGNHIMCDDRCKSSCTFRKSLKVIFCNCTVIHYLFTFFPALNSSAMSFLHCSVRL